MADSPSSQAEAEAEAECERVSEKGGPSSPSKKRPKGASVDDHEPSAKKPNNEKEKAKVEKSAKKSGTVWKTTDELTFLEHLVAVCNEWECVPKSLSAFYEIVRPHLKDDFSNDQLYNKKRFLKSKYYALKKKKEDMESGKLGGHEKNVYKLAKQVWGRWQEEDVKKKKEKTDEMAVGIKAARGTNEQVGNPKEQRGEEEEEEDNSKEEEMRRENESLGMGMGRKEVEAAVAAAVDYAEREREVLNQNLNPPHAAQDRRPPVRRRRREEEDVKKKKKTDDEKAAMGTNEQVDNPQEQRGEEEEVPLPQVRAEEEEERREIESLGMGMGRKDVDADAAVAAVVDHADHHDGAERERAMAILNYVINPPEDHGRPPVRRIIVPANNNNNDVCSFGNPYVRFEEMCKASLKVHNAEMLRTYERITAAVAKGVKEVDSAAERRKKELEAVFNNNHDLDSSLLSKLSYSRKLVKLSQSEEKRFVDRWRKQNDVEMRAAEGRVELMLEEHRARMAEAGLRQ